MPNATCAVWLMRAVMQQPSALSISTNPPASSPWDQLFWGVVILVLAPLLLVTVIGRVVLIGTVYWVYGSAGYTSGIRVHFVGKTPWFTNGERVPNWLATAGSVGAFVTSVLLAYVVAYCVRYVYRLTRTGQRENA